MLRFNRDVLGKLDVVNGLENRETLADGSDSHFLEGLRVEKA